MMCVGGDEPVSPPCMEKKKAHEEVKCGISLGRQVGAKLGMPECHSGGWNYVLLVQGALE